jgi:hypothetical protein
LSSSPAAAAAAKRKYMYQQRHSYRKFPVHNCIEAAMLCWLEGLRRISSVPLPIQWAFSSFFFNWVGKSGRLYQPFCLWTWPGESEKNEPCLPACLTDRQTFTTACVTYVVNDTLLSKYDKYKTKILYYNVRNRLIVSPPSPLWGEGGLGGWGALIRTANQLKSSDFPTPRGYEQAVHPPFNI